MVRVQDLMIADVVCVPQRATVAEASQLLRKHAVNGAPVVDDSGTPIGVISLTDLMSGWVQAEVHRQRVFYRSATREIHPGTTDPLSAFADRPVSEIMMSLVFSVQRQDSVIKAAELMLAEGIHRLIVLDGTHLVGILSASDIVRGVAQGLFVPAS